jgi:hypothetical protein
VGQAGEALGEACCVKMRLYTVRELAAELRRAVPLAYPVRVRTRKLPRGHAGDDALTELVQAGDRREFRITLAPHVKCPVCRHMNLLHEWSHAANWRHDYDLPSTNHDDFHDGAWGATYSKVYLAYTRLGASNACEA